MIEKRCLQCNKPASKFKTKKRNTQFCSMKCYSKYPRSKKYRNNISKSLNEYFVTNPGNRKGQEYKKLLLNISKKELFNMYHTQHMSQFKIANFLNSTTWRVSTTLQHYNILKRNLREAQKCRVVWTKEEDKILRNSLNNVNMVTLCNMLHKTKSAINRRRSKLKIYYTRFHQNQKTQKTKSKNYPPKSELQKLYKINTIKSLEQMFRGIHISKLIKKYGIQKRTHSENQQLVHNRNEVKRKKSLAQSGDTNSMYGTSRRGKENPNYGNGEKLRKYYQEHPELREKIRERVQKLVNKKYGGGFIGKHETPILDFVEKQLNIKLERQYKCIGYFIDGYCIEYNLAVEVDEPHHFYAKGGQREKDIERQNNIQKKLGCNFLRIKDDYIRIVNKYGGIKNEK